MSMLDVRNVSKGSTLANPMLHLAERLHRTETTLNKWRVLGPRVSLINDQKT